MIDKLMITAHPDDEALFGGAELLTHPTEYKVVVVDEYHDKIRRKEFKKSMEFIGIEDYEHWTGYKGGEDYHREKLIYELLRVLRERKYIKIVTHNKQGEYGHPRHRALHDILNHLRPEILWQFWHCWLEKSQILIVSSEQPDTTCFPSGVKERDTVYLVGS